MSLYSVRRAYYIVTIWAESSAPGALTWRGYLESPDGKRMYFSSLAQLNRLLREAGGWSDPLETKDLQQPITSEGDSL